MKAKLLSLAVPCALAFGLLASAQSTHEVGQPGTPVHKTHVQPLPTQPGWPANLIEPVATPKGEAVQFCTSMPNSTGKRAFIGCSSDFSVCHNNMCLMAFDVPADVNGLFFYGGQATQVPLANGFLCVSPFHPGLFRLPGVHTAVDNTAHLMMDFQTLPAAGAVTCGSTWYFQFWFRDPLAGGAGSNLSDGVAITFCQ